MKTNELMIGDWVNYRPGWIDEDSGKVVYESGTGFPVRVEFIYNCRGGEGLIQYNDGENDGIEAAEYELFPIPLTSEILEKNGFIKVRDFLWEIRTQDTCIKYEWHGKIMLEITNKLTRKDKYGRCNIAAFTVGWMDDMFVHELQHALRLCGIEKEIIL